MSLLNIKPQPISNDPFDWVYEATYKRNGYIQTFKFNPLQGADPLNTARNIVFQEYKGRNGEIRDDLYPGYLNAQIT